MSTATLNVLSATTHQPPAAHLVIVAVLLVVALAVLLVGRLRRRRGPSSTADHQPSSGRLRGPSNSQSGEAPEDDRPPRE